MNEIATIKNVVLKKDKKIILNIPELRLPKNKIISLVGPSGAGKTTLLNLLSKIEIAKDSKIELYKNITTADIGYILQDNLLYEEISVFQNIYLSAKNSFVWRKEKRSEFLQNWKDLKIKKSTYITKQVNKYLNNLDPKKEKQIFLWVWFLLFWFYLFTNLNFFKEFVKELRLKHFFKKDLDFIAKKVEITEILNNKAQNISGGQKQRVLIAKAIVKKSELILMDEPFSALDVKIKEKTIEWIAKIKREFNLSIILVTHDQNDALKLSDYILVMRNGKIEQFDTKDNVLDRPATFFVANFFCSPELNLISQDKDSKSFIKPRDIYISKAKGYSSELTIIHKENIGDLTIYKVSDCDSTYTSLSTNNKLSVGDLVDIKIDQQKILRFKNEEIAI
ncbi:MULTISPECIES: ABC transporter ATP-binding protein [unclassified Mycoplasma]|uniref:ATP-binding cassette domain-containing protein n=1 Tax=unclassified Mycoplasma TaxID=2683645 RepID=UPI00211B9DBD|nr:MULTISPECIES: ABC transporter ATP-binding protein [unclassified Mycoplasma]UUM19903.1 ABC transporter ATP-binding protein [Mycoplasma sp. 1578d]UUM24883.1 ABC transporter ATP-binding protein [Mycoplasma sp. 3686d]